MTTWTEVLAEHNPRPPGDRFEHPWWVKGEYARKNETKWTAPDGTRIESGKVVSLGNASWSPSVTPPSVSRAPAATKVPVVPKKARKAPDEHAIRLAACKTEDDWIALFNQYGLDPCLRTNPAPNNGVRNMRILNAMRRTK